MSLQRQVGEQTYMGKTFLGNLEPVPQLSQDHQGQPVGFDRKIASSNDGGSGIVNVD